MKKALILLGVLMLFSASLFAGEKPMKISFEGSFSTSTAFVNFYISSDTVSGTRLPNNQSPWTERLDNDSKDGHISYALGSQNPIPKSIFKHASETRYLEIAADNGNSSFVELIPVPYAQHAEHATTADKLKSQTGKIVLENDTHILGTLKVGEHCVTTTSNEIRFSSNIPTNAYITSENLPMIIRSTGPSTSNTLTLQTDNANIIMNPGTANIGVGGTPNYRLDVYGTIRSTQSAYFATDTGNVGIGISSPTAKLDVNGQIQIRGGTPIDGYVLKCSSSGLASWQSGGDTDWTETSGGTVVYRLSGNVGIGTSSPASKLNVTGNIIYPEIN